LVKSGLKTATKFMQSLDPQIYAQLRKMAKDRGITMQELIRAVIVPDWMKKAGDAGQKGSPRAGRKPIRRLRRARPTITA
jgi:hypothetical protein